MNHFFDTNDLGQGIARKLADGLEARIFSGDNVMVSVVRIEPGAHGREHAHAEEQWGYCLAGGGVRRQGGADHRVKAGDLWFTPGNVPHGFRAGPAGAVILDIFSPPRPEYRQAGEGVGGA